MKNRLIMLMYACMLMCCSHFSFCQRFTLRNTGLKIELIYNIIEDSIVRQDINVINNSGEIIFFPKIVKSYSFLDNTYTSIGMALHKPGGGINYGHVISCDKLNVNDTLSFSINLKIDSCIFKRQAKIISNDYIFAKNCKNNEIQEIERDFLINSDFYIDNYQFVVVEIPPFSEDCKTRNDIK